MNCEHDRSKTRQYVAALVRCPNSFNQLRGELARSRRSRRRKRIGKSCVMMAMAGKNYHRRERDWLVKIHGDDGDNDDDEMNKIKNHTQKYNSQRNETRDKTKRRQYTPHSTQSGCMRNCIVRRCVCVLFPLKFLLHYSCVVLQCIVLCGSMCMDDVWGTSSNTLTHTLSAGAPFSGAVTQTPQRQR